MNEVILCGCAAANPEIRYISKTLTAYARFTLALPQQSGDESAKVEYVPVICSGDLAERCERYLVKGAYAVVKGYLRTRKTVYEGRSIPTMDVVAVDVIFPTTRIRTHKELFYGTPDLDKAPPHLPSEEFGEDIEPLPEGVTLLPKNFAF